MHTIEGIPAETPTAGPLPVSPRPRARGRLTPFLLGLPSVLLIAVFLVGPVVAAFLVSLTNQALTGIHALYYTNVGLSNYRSLFTDPVFFHSAYVSFLYVVLAAVIGETGLGLLVAFLMHRGASRLAIRFVGSTMIAAWVVPEIVAAFIWLAFGSQGGTLDKILRPAGLGQFAWLSQLPLILVSLATVWAGAAFSMLIFSAGLRGLPDEVIEAAVVDGARSWQRIRQVELPMLRRTFAVNLILVTLATLTDFTLIYALTGGGPGDATQTIPQYAYQLTFSFAQLGAGDAAAVVLLIVAAAISVLYVLLLKVEV
jgi:multiple sugar transport system permease protein